MTWFWPEKSPDSFNEVRPVCESDEGRNFSALFSGPRSSL
jgi:hypothetical protein